MPREVTVLTESDLRRLVRLDLPAIDVVERAFAALASGAVVMPPVLSMAIPEANGEVDVKTAYIPGFDGFAIKVSPGFFDNPKIGLPSLNGLMILFSAKTGLVEALLLDNGYLTDVRTAAAGAVAARHLAPAAVDTAGVIGTGTQARLQIWCGRSARCWSGAATRKRRAAAPATSPGSSASRRRPWPIPPGWWRKASSS
jgi:ornithine cyclodeaminase